MSRLVASMADCAAKRQTELPQWIEVMRVVNESDEAMIITEGGVVVRTPVKGISKLGRSTQGVRVMDVNDGDHVSALATGNPDD